MNRIVIVCASPIKNYKKIRKYLRNDDYFIFCDGGLFHQKSLKVAPDMIIGDFDSYKKNPALLQKKYKNCKIITLPKEKDDTDSIYASKKAMELKPTEVILLGAVGNRFDHSMANISILINLFNNGINCKLIDDFSVMQIVGKEEVQVSKEYSFFSLINICGTCEGIDIKDAMYPLNNGTINCDFQYGISNQVLKGKEYSTVNVKNGCGLLIMDF